MAQVKRVQVNKIKRSRGKIGDQVELREVKS